MRLAILGLLLGEALLLAGVALVFVPAAMVLAGVQLVYLALTSDVVRQKARA